MGKLLILDASARPGLGGLDPHGSYSRRLTRQFHERWAAAHPDKVIAYRDIGLAPPAAVSHAWIEAAFTPAEARTPAMREALKESDALTAELLAADRVVIGTPLYNFGMPAPLKAWVDNVVRLGLTVDFRPEEPENPYLPLLAGRDVRVAVLAARGGYGLDPGGPYAHMNHLEPSLRTALGFIGIDSVQSIAVEYQEVGGDQLADSLARALHEVDALADAWLAETACAQAA